MALTNFHNFNLSVIKFYTRIPIQNYLGRVLVGANFFELNLFKLEIICAKSKCFFHNAHYFMIFSEQTRQGWLSGIRGNLGNNRLWGKFSVTRILSISKQPCTERIGTYQLWKIIINFLYKWHEGPFILIFKSKQFCVLLNNYWNRI